jgi:hypothetical protein
MDALALSNGAKSNSPLDLHDFTNKLDHKADAQIHWGSPT